MPTIILIIIMYFVYTNFFGEESGCDEYASKFSCNYLLDKANYDVYYWRNLSNDDENDEKLIGNTTGLLNCKNYAVNYASSINEAWNDRAYICMLVKDGANLEKHRHLGENIFNYTFESNQTTFATPSNSDSYEDEEDLSISVKALMQRSIQDKSTPTLSFSTQAEGEIWLNDMSQRLSKRIPDKAYREDFLKTLHYEANRAGLDPQMILGFIETTSNFKKYAVSKSGARGFMQVNPVWVRNIGNQDHNLFLLRTNLRYGTTVLRYYLDMENGDIFQALTRYGIDIDNPSLPKATLNAWHKNWEYPKQHSADLNVMETPQIEQAKSEQIYVKYRGNLDLTPFQCELTEGSTVKRLCYDAKEEYAVVKLKSTYYHYCQIPAQVISNWRQATSLDNYYYSNIKSNFDCRVFRVPAYANNLSSTKKIKG